MPKPKAKKFWQFRNQTADSAELLLYGDISDTSWWGDEVTPKQFADELNALGDVQEITVRINSGGGDVFAATAIGNMLEQCKANVIAKIDGLCASAATIIACHCSKVIAANDSTYMIHPVKMGLFGYADATTIQQYLDALSAIRENIITLYAKKTGRDKEEVAEQMDNTSWFTGAEAKANGYVDELIDDEEDEAVIENRGGLLFVNSIETSIPFDDAPKFVQDNAAAAPAADCVVNTNPDNEPVDTTNRQEDKSMDNIKTVDDLRQSYPELVGQIEAAAAEKAANIERQRIKDIEEMCVAGSEDFANKAKYEKPINASEFAMELIKNAKAAENNAKNAFISGIAQDISDSGMEEVAQEATDSQQQDEFMDALHTVAQNK
ncbi:MAG: Clp protease ClpP [Lachnospiraceae bacterium]|jgi:ATP-dependent protease ClpP protease subunit|nr:Clp protease ClpP [Lachnospiraceae bacterium]